MHQPKIKKAKEIIVDTAVQEKNITFPTDEKLYKKIIQTCDSLAQKVSVKLRQSYRFVVKKLTYAKRYAAKAFQGQVSKRVVKKLRTIAGRKVRDLARKLAIKGQETLHNFSAQLAIMEKALKQGRKEKDKIYSLHAPEVSCIAKSKSGKKYEFGSKVSVAVLPGSIVVVGIKSYWVNPHDSNTFKETV